MFTVIEGRQSADFNHFEYYDLESINATETRLMGVVAMKICWKSKTSSKAFFYQVLHLDYSEFGVDDYFEYECLPDSDDYADCICEAELKWSSFVACMGGRIVELTPAVAVRLIDDAIDVWLKSEMLERGDENEEFRHGALKRISMMKKSLIDRGAMAEGESEALDELQCIEAVAPKKLATYETINYFIMRMVDRDINAAAFLSVISKEDLAASPLINSDLQSLTRNSITSARGGEVSAASMYFCKFISMGYDAYYYGSLSITLTGTNLQKNRKVSAVDIGFHKKLSTYESAMLVKRSEYITVYDFDQELPDRFRINRITMMEGATTTAVGNGILYMQYNADNAHVNKAEYYLNGDVKCAALMTLAGELIVMSYQIMNISMLEASIAGSIYAQELQLKGRYEVPNMVFQTMCETPGLKFEQVIISDDE
ncbi:MAG: hypothetical protein KBS68_00565 [Clostridiales bacterium]|nr:hypothetical protein [Candidatus Crickella merdequi]